MSLIYKFKKQIISVILSLVSLLIVIILIIIPTFKAINSLNKEIKQQEKELENQLARGLNAKKIKEKLNEIEIYINDIDKIFLEKESELKIITQLESLASTNGIEILIKPDFKIQNFNNNIGIFPLSMTIYGNYLSIMKFLKDLECQEYYYNIDNANLSRIDNKNFSIISLNISGNFFIKK